MNSHLGQYYNCLSWSHILVDICDKCWIWLVQIMASELLNSNNLQCTGNDKASKNLYQTTVAYCVISVVKWLLYCTCYAIHENSHIIIADWWGVYTISHGSTKYWVYAYMLKCPLNPLNVNVASYMPYWLYRKPLKCWTGNFLPLSYNNAIYNCDMWCHFPAVSFPTHWSISHFLYIDLELLVWKLINLVFSEMKECPISSCMHTHRFQQ